MRPRRLFKKLFVPSHAPPTRLPTLSAREFLRIEDFADAIVPNVDDLITNGHVRSPVSSLEQVFLMPLF